MCYKSSTILLIHKQKKDCFCWNPKTESLFDQTSDLHFVSLKPISYIQNSFEIISVYFLEYPTWNIQQQARILTAFIIALFFCQLRETNIIRHDFLRIWILSTKPKLHCHEISSRIYTSQSNATGRKIQITSGYGGKGYD